MLDSFNVLSRVVSVRFSINVTTGDVSVGVDADLDWSLLDREKLDTHQVTVEAVDGGGRRSSVRLDVELLDVNDQTPEIAWSRYDTYVRENEVALERAVVVEVNAAFPHYSIQGSRIKQVVLFDTILLRLFAASFLVRMLSAKSLVMPYSVVATQQGCSTEMVNVTVFFVLFQLVEY